MQTQIPGQEMFSHDIQYFVTARLSVSTVAQIFGKVSEKNVVRKILITSAKRHPHMERIEAKAVVSISYSARCLSEIVVVIYHIPPLVFLGDNSTFYSSYLI